MVLRDSEDPVRVCGIRESSRVEWIQAGSEGERWPSQGLRESEEPVRV